MTDNIQELEELIRDKQQELNTLKQEYRDKRTSGLKAAMETKREAEKLIREEMKALGYLSRDNDSWNSTIRWYNF